MPNVKGKKFPYSKEGIKAAKEYAESDARGRSEKYQWGGLVPSQRGLPRRPVAPPIAPTAGNIPGFPRPPRPTPTYKKGGKVKK